MILSLNILPQDTEAAGQEMEANANNGFSLISKYARALTRAYANERVLREQGFMTIQIRQATDHPANQVSCCKGWDAEKV